MAGTSLSPLTAHCPSGGVSFSFSLPSTFEFFPGFCLAQCCILPHSVSLSLLVGFSAALLSLLLREHPLLCYFVALPSLLFAFSCLYSSLPFEKELSSPFSSLCIPPFWCGSEQEQAGFLFTWPSLPAFLLPKAHTNFCKSGQACFGKWCSVCCWGFWQRLPPPPACTLPPATTSLTSLTVLFPTAAALYC